MIFALPLYDDNPVRETPVVTYVLIGMCIGAFLWELGHNADVVTFQYGMIPAVVFGYAELPARLAAIPPWATKFSPCWPRTSRRACWTALRRRPTHHHSS